MFGTEWIQKIIHILDVGIGYRVMRVLIVGMMVAVLALRYDLHDFKSFSTPEAMDSAQLARNIAEGRGYTTDFVRPLSIYLLRAWNEAQSIGKTVGANPDFARLQAAHPDLANPPVYPVFLAGWMKVLSFKWIAQTSEAFWSEDGHFVRYQPEFLIGVINQLLLLVVVWQTFLIARKLFDLEVAWVSAILVLGCEMLWKFSVSGLSTLLVIVIFLGLTRLLIALEETGRAQDPPVKKLYQLAFLAGVLTGVGALTRYSFGWMVVPLLFFTGLFGGRERGRQAVVAGAGFLVVLAPWVVRNYLVSGTPFGTAGFAIMETDSYFPGFQLERSVNPELLKAWLIMPYVYKLLANLQTVLQNDVPLLGRSWAIMLFIAGLLSGFRGLHIRRLRWFLLMSLATLAVVQALGRTQLSEESPVINSENLLVLLLPLILIYATAFFFTGLDQMEMPLQAPLPPLRYAAMAGLIGVLCLPMLGALFSKKTNSLAYPPYYPPQIQQYSGWMKENELMISDVPWAVAWYGHRQCLWLTLNAKEDFYAVNDNLKPIHALYLTQETLDAKLISTYINSPDNSWDRFILKKVSVDVSMNIMSRYLEPGAFSKFIIGKTPPEVAPFPLNVAYDTGPLNSTLFLTDRVRWLAPLQH